MCWDKVSFCLDKFHLNKAIIRAIGHLGDSASDTRRAINDDIRYEDKKAVNKVFTWPSSAQIARVEENR
ncbi:protein of unknown function [Petrocella atlantisensis]|uniref:Uncharacterized protein n=1 Tax=Petrocella atlantisensis TaxID=2173034 RepID=A0A3P7PUB7_9FIRM|nr:hypothetical protein [Petrocella atlantisensis]VDN47547.1 protein of unknown function [Petrocella atlantisensis]